MSAFGSLYQSARELWKQYLKRGPGKLSQDELDEFLAHKAAIQDVSTDTVELHALLEELEPLLRRCVERSEGLCFVTGEAGLIPRRDLHEKCEELLDRLQSLTQQR